jgi:glycosyltransferase involved in cell wall biosynthesis
MLVQQIDERDWLRAFIVTWVRALAAHVDRLDILTLERGEAWLPDNVYVRSMGKEDGKNRARELLRFHQGMMELAPHADVIFSHMTPRYSLLAAPYAALFRKRQVLWYTHRNPSRQARLATRVIWRAATAAPDSYPVDSPKVRALGHGIDADFYAPDASAKNTPPTIVHVARLMPIKHQATLIRAIANLLDAQAVFVGDVPTGQEGYRDYADSLKKLAAELGVAQRVTFAGGLLAPAVRDTYRQATLAVNLSPVGLFDKAALESMATGVPTLVSTHAFDALLGDNPDQFRIDGPEDVDGLTARLRDLLALSPQQRAALGAIQRERVVAAHSLTQLMPRLVRLFETGEIEM